jgi:hypothetical protein
MKRLRQLCLEESPEPLKKRQLYATPSFFDVRVKVEVMRKETGATILDFGQILTLTWHLNN